LSVTEDDDEVLRDKVSQYL